MSKSINLLPDPVIDTQRDFTKIYQGVIITLIGLIVFGLFNLTLFFLSEQAQNSLLETQNRSDTLTEEIRALRPVEQEIARLQSRLSDYQRAKNVDKNLRQYWDIILSAATDEMQLTDLELNTQGGLNVSATTDSLRNAVDFLLVLKNSDDLSNFQVLAINYSQTNERYFFETKITIP
jgi:Tfp pilus assembly protein PilN